MKKGEPNKDLIRDLRQTLALAEDGTLTDGSIIAFGPEAIHKKASFKRPEDMVTLISEIGLFKTELELVVMGQRTQQAQNRAAGVIGPAHHKH